MISAQPRFHQRADAIQAYGTVNHLLPPEFMAEAVRDGKLVIPITLKLPLSEAAEGQAAAEKGAVGKILLVA